MDQTPDKHMKKYKKPSQEYCGKRFKQQNIFIFQQITTNFSNKKKLESQFNPNTKIPLSHKANKKKLNFHYPKLASFMLCRPCSDLVEYSKLT